MFSVVDNTAGIGQHRKNLNRRIGPAVTSVTEGGRYDGDFTALATVTRVTGEVDCAG